eukprot:scpid42456/ scgid33257/ 
MIAREVEINVRHHRAFLQRLSMGWHELCKSPRASLPKPTPNVALEVWTAVSGGGWPEGMTDTMYSDITFPSRHGIAPTRKYGRKADDDDDDGDTDMRFFLFRVVCSGDVTVLNNMCKTFSELSKSNPESTTHTSSPAGAAAAAFTSHMNQVWSYQNPEDSWVDVEGDGVRKPVPQPPRQWYRHVFKHRLASKHEHSPCTGDTSDSEYTLCTVYKAPKVRDLVNTRISGFPLLNFAIVCGHVDMVECLLRWGADPFWLAQDSEKMRSPFSARIYGPPAEQVGETYNALFTAVILREPHIVRTLIRHSAERRLVPEPCFFWYNHHMDHLTLFEACSGDVAVLDALCSDPRLPLPIEEAFCAYKTDANQEAAALLLSHVRWNASCTTGIKMGETLSFLDSRIAPVLEAPCYTDVEFTCKKFFCFAAMLRLCSFYAPPSERRGQMKCMQILFCQGASPSGLPLAKARSLFRKWLNAKRREELHRYVPSPYTFATSGVSSVAEWHILAPCVQGIVRERILLKLPPCLREPLRASHIPGVFDIFPAVLRLVCTRDLNDDVLQLLIKHGGMPGIGSVAEIPFVDNQLHDGPTCECSVKLTAEQREHRLEDVICLQRQPLQLAQLCRSTVIDAFRGAISEDAVNALGLPPKLAAYLRFE